MFCVTNSNIIIILTNFGIKENAIESSVVCVCVVCVCFSISLFLAVQAIKKNKVTFCVFACLCVWFR